MSDTLSVLKLHTNRRTFTFLIPLNITALVVLLSILVSLLFWRSGSVPGSAEWVQGSQSNPAILYSLAGFLVYLGVQSVASTFPFTLSLGATRRAFVTGTLIWTLVMSAYLAIVFGILCSIELLTHHWFVDFYIFDVYVLGAGDIGRLLLIVFLGSLTCLMLGGVFGAAWVRFGARGPQMLAICLAIVVLVGLIIVIPDAHTFVASFKLWWLAVAAVIVVLLSAIGSWLFLRSAIVR